MWKNADETMAHDAQEKKSDVGGREKRSALARRAMHCAHSPGQYTLYIYACVRKMQASQSAALAEKWQMQRRVRGCPLQDA